MARYYPVSPQFWTDPKVRQWDDSARTLALYLLTCPHRNLEGLYRLPLSYVTADLDWPMQKLREALRQLEEDDFLLRDKTTDVVLIRRALKYQAPKSAKQIKGAITALAEVPMSTVHSAFLEACQTYAPTLADAIRMALDTHSEGVPA